MVTARVPVTQQIIEVDAEGTPIRWRFGNIYQTSEKCTLCRCGHSISKPFCDGTHVKIDFDGTEDADKSYDEQVKVIIGPSLTLKDAEILCASARFCHRAGGIWNLVPKSNDPEAKTIAIEEARDCPSGRLVVEDKETGRVCEPEFDQSIALIEDPQMGVSGPVWVRGGIPIESGNGETYQIRNRVTLCRCGKSTIKPFCDSSHYPEEHEHGNENK